MYAYNNEIFNPFEKKNLTINKTIVRTRNWQCKNNLQIISIHSPLEEITIKIGKDEVIASR